MRGLPWHARKARAACRRSFPPAPHLPTLGTEYTEPQIFWVAKHGVRRTGMFANGLWDSDEKLWKAAAFIKKDRVASGR